jgi:hypothetical protein
MRVSHSGPPVGQGNTGKNAGATWGQCYTHVGPAFLPAPPSTAVKAPAIFEALGPPQPTPARMPVPGITIHAITKAVKLRNVESGRAALSAIHSLKDSFGLLRQARLSQAGCP